MDRHAGHIQRESRPAVAVASPHVCCEPNFPASSAGVGSSALGVLHFRRAVMLVSLWKARVIGLPRGLR